MCICLPFWNRQRWISGREKGDQLVVIHHSRAQEEAPFGFLVLVDEDVSERYIIDMDVSHPSVPLEVLRFSC